METILIECPHCHEKMQAPADRESVICMFCGKTIDLSAMTKETNEQIVDAGKCYENLNFVLSNTEGVFRDFRQKVRDFKKDSYTGLFENYKEENYAYFTALKICLVNTAEADKDGVYHQIASAFVRYNQQEMDSVGKKNEKFAVQMDRNMFMAIFVLPAMKEIQNKSSDELAEVICTEWSTAFKDSNIIASDYDSIIAGFHKKLCYVTTAVCQNIHKTDDCDELRLIKEFRDGYLAHTDGGQQLIDEYYDIAPTLVKRIARDHEAKEKYAWLWETYLKPCVALIQNGENEECKEVYCEMVESLRKEYM